MSRPTIDRKSLSVQMVLSFVGLVLLTAVAAGLPAVWLLRNQLEGQAWAQLEQGRQAAQALYAARRIELDSLATLTAQRPTLLRLLQQAQGEAMPGYLETLRAGADLDLLAVCSRHNELIAMVNTGKASENGLCSPSAGGYLAAQPAGATGPEIWLVAAHDVVDAEQALLGRVVVGEALDGDFAGLMRSQTGLEHAVFLDNRIVAASLAGEPRERQPAVGASTGEQERTTYTRQGQPYYALTLPMAGSGQDLDLHAEVALNVAGIVATEERLLRILGFSILLAAGAGSILAVLLARRISRPLAYLASAAAALSGRDATAAAGNGQQALAVPIAVNELTSSVREVALVAQALETARGDLQQTLDELRREKAWTDHLLSAIVEGIVTLDRQGYVTFWSRGAERITGLSREQVLGLSCDRVFKPAVNSTPFSALLPAPGRSSKIAVELADGRQAVLAVTGARLSPVPPSLQGGPEPEGGEARVALVFRDISEEEAVHRLLSHFLANVSHEFRTPLSAVAASVELLLDQASDLSPAELQELLTSLHLGVVNLQKLVDNLLESASIEAGRFRVHPRSADLGEIIAEATGTMQPLLDKHGQQLTVDLPAAIPIVHADPRRTVQVLVNLLSNASKYGPDNAGIAIDVLPEDGWVRVAVADCGPGIPAAQRRDLFRRFAAPNDAPVGFGLGLSVVKAIVEGHGGQVGVEDRAGGGAVFWFTLPKALA